MMKYKLLVLLFIILPLSMITQAATPTESLREAVDGLLSIAADRSIDNAEKKAQIVKVVKQKVDLQVLSKRVISRYWKQANKADKQEFIGLFTQVVVNTYFTLLKEYTNEQVEYLKEEIKKQKYAKVKTHIVMKDKKIPVTYKLILRQGLWRIYDFSAEGLSLISTYSNDYKSTLKRVGLSGLNEILKKKLAKTAG